jgi:hypothetical protein
MDLMLGPDGDVLIPADGQPRLTSGTAQAAAQRLRIRCLTFLGEWFLDTTAGIPYFQEIFTQIPDEGILRTLFRNQVGADSYVVAVPECEVTIDRRTRNLEVRFVAQVVSGEAIAFDISANLVDNQLTIDGIGITIDGVPIVIL